MVVVVGIVYQHNAGYQAEFEGNSMGTENISSSTDFLLDSITI
jgi:hypothetical protein